MRRIQTGGAAVELTLVTPLLILLLVFVVGLGRLASSRIDVNVAAHDAARAASIARDPADASRAAKDAAESTLHGVTCATLDVAVDTSAFHPGGSVAVRVTCTVDLGDLGALHMPATTTVSARFSSPIDLYRSGP